MSKKNEEASRIGYDVCRVHPNILQPIILTGDERRKITKSFYPHSPSEEFMNSFIRAVSIFILDVAEVQKMTPAKVGGRVNGVHRKALELLGEIDALEISDQSFLDRHFTTLFLQDRKCVSLNEFSSYLKHFIENTSAAVQTLEGVQKRGRLPAFSEQCLALEVGRAILVETGAPPALTRSGLFDHVLRCALSIGDNRLARRVGKVRRDVMELMLHARSEIDSG